MTARVRTMGITTVCVACNGCSRAPSVSVVGSFFPIWMVCLIAGIIMAFVARALLVRFKLEGDIGPPALFYPCVVTLCTCLLWLICFR